jgi:hypothetical protein
VEVTVRFEVKDHRSISFTQERISNMAPRREIHAHFAREDTRIPPYACYEHEDDRSYYNDTILTYHLRKDIEIRDTSGNEGGADGGPNSRGRTLPPIIYPKASIDTTVGKVAGALKSMPGPTAARRMAQKMRRVRTRISYAGLHRLLTKASR